MEQSSFCPILTEKDEKSKSETGKEKYFQLPDGPVKEILAFLRKKAYNKLIHFTYFYEVLLCI